MPAELVVLFAAVIGGSWAYLAYQAWQMQHLPMSEMWMAPTGLTDWQVGDVAWVFGMWAVMMAAMMLPSALPMLNAFSRYCQRDSSARPSRTLWFASGYLLAWLAYSLVLTLTQWLFHGWTWLSPMMENRQPWVAATILLIAGIYQFTAFKNACLSHCRSPFAFLLHHWRPGNVGALQIGFNHGLTCLGCCWAQMLVMFAVGVMSLAGMLIITSLVFVEKTAPVSSGKLRVGIGLLFIFWSGYTVVQIS
ncbi:MAG: DUF2182 domain-containing protein [Gammaproteobacteria bacterium]